MKHILALLVTAWMGTFALAEPTPTEAAQAEAVRLYPKIATKGSPENTSFLQAVSAAKKSKDPVLLQQDWPLVIAKRVFATPASPSNNPLGPSQLLGKTFEECEKTLGKPSKTEEQKDQSGFGHYYQAPRSGITTLLLERTWQVVDAPKGFLPSKINGVSFCFPKGKTWRDAFLLIGLNPDEVKILKDGGNESATILVNKPRYLYDTIWVPAGFSFSPSQPSRHPDEDQLIFSVFLKDESKETTEKSVEVRMTKFLSPELKQFFATGPVKEVKENGIVFENQEGSPLNSGTTFAVDAGTKIIASTPGMQWGDFRKTLKAGDIVTVSIAAMRPPNGPKETAASLRRGWVVNSGAGIKDELGNLILEYRK